MRNRVILGTLAALLLTLALAGVAGAERRPIWPIEPTSTRLER